MTDKVKQSINKILEMFRTENMPEKVAYLCNPGQNIPFTKWSLNNKLIVFFSGSMDARGFNQWKKVNRNVKKGAQALHILVPTKKQCSVCNECKKVHYKNKQHPCFDKKTFSCCNKVQQWSNTLNGYTKFKGVPVFKVEDTDGAALDYEKIEVPQHRFIELAKSWGLEVKSGCFIGYCYGYYRPKDKIVLASPDEEVFYHELAHAAHDRLGLLRKSKNNSGNEIIAEFASAVITYMNGNKTEKLRNSYEYLEHYAKQINKSVDKAVLKLLSEIEKVVNYILDEEKQLTYNS